MAQLLQLPWAWTTGDYTKAYWLTQWLTGGLANAEISKIRRVIVSRCLLVEFFSNNIENRFLEPVLFGIVIWWLNLADVEHDEEENNDNNKAKWRNEEEILIESVDNQMSSTSSSIQSIDFHSICHKSIFRRLSSESESFFFSRSQLTTMRWLDYDDAENELCTFLPSSEHFDLFTRIPFQEDWVDHKEKEEEERKSLFPGQLSHEIIC